MKIPLKNRPISVVPGIPDYSSPLAEIKAFDYAHDEPLLGEIAGHVFNRYLRFRREGNSFGEQYDFRFGSSNPNKAQLYLRQTIDRMDEQQSNGRIKEFVFEQACEELLYKAFEAIDAMHKLDNSFFDRIKYVFTRN